jgi:hypothetical protein
MSFIKALEHGKKKQAKHYKSQQAKYGYPRCDCSWCVGNRMYSTNRKDIEWEKVNEVINEREL